MVHVKRRSNLKPPNYWLTCLEAFVCIVMYSRVGNVAAIRISKTVDGIQVSESGLHRRDAVWSKYDYYDVSSLVDIHNSYRRNVTPTASDMNYVVSV